MLCNIVSTEICAGLAGISIHIHVNRKFTMGKWRSFFFFFGRKISFLTDRHCIVLEVFQGMKKV